MKKLLFFLTGVLTLITFGCTSDDIEPQMPDSLDGPKSRAAVTYLSSTNKTLLTHWDSCSTVKLLGPQGRAINIPLPWSAVANTSLSQTFTHDILPKDGWIMLFHTFRDLYTDPNLNYMCFYNRFSGMVKIFYYSHQPDEGERTVWNVGSAIANVNQPLFSYYESFANPLSGGTSYNNSSIMLENANTTGSKLETGWNGFEFPLSAYQKKMADNNIQIAAYNTVYTNFSFNGETTSTTTGTITTINGYTNPVVDNPVTEAALTKVGPEAENLLKKLANKIPDKNFLTIKLKEALSKIKSGSIIDGLKKGLGFIFKSFTRPESTVSQVSLTTQGKITMGGKGETKKVSHVSSITFDLNKLLSATPIVQNNIASLANEQSRNIELGVWNLKNRPTISYCRYSKVLNQADIPDNNSTFFDVYGYVYLPETSITNVNIEFNPDIKPYVKSYTVETAMLDVEGGNRKVSTSGAYNRFLIDRSNLIYKSDSVMTPIRIYGIAENQRQNFRGLVYDVPYGAEVNNNTELYYDWGTNAFGNRAVAVILTWTIQYEGKTQTFTESRLYDVNYEYNLVPYNENVVNTPPYTFLLKNSNFNSSLALPPVPDEKFNLVIPAVTADLGVGLSQ